MAGAALQGNALLGRWTVGPVIVAITALKLRLSCVAKLIEPTRRWWRLAKVLWWQSQVVLVGEQVVERRRLVPSRTRRVVVSGRRITTRQEAL